MKEIGRTWKEENWIVKIYSPGLDRLAAPIFDDPSRTLFGSWPILWEPLCRVVDSVYESGWSSLWKSFQN